MLNRLLCSGFMKLKKQKKFLNNTFQIKLDLL